jgi:rubrerythrin
MGIDQELRQQLLCYQRNEITEHHIYARLAATIKSAENRLILEDIAADELRHYEMWKTHTRQEVSANRFEVWKHY